MNVNYDDLIAYLNQSEDWHELETGPRWITYAGPLDAEDKPIEIALPSNPHATDTQSLMAIAVGILATLEGIHANTMADRITPSSVRVLMDAIKRFDCEPSVFKVDLWAASHLSGYQACVDFRTYQPGAVSTVATRGDTPEEALARLLATLKAKWGRCPHCGKYLDGREEK